MEYLGKTCLKKEFKIERVKSRYNTHNLPIEVALRTQNKSPVSLKSTINELCLWWVIFTLNQFLLLVFVQACTSAWRWTSVSLANRRGQRPWSAWSDSAIPSQRKRCSCREPGRSVWTRGNTRFESRCGRRQTVVHKRSLLLTSSCLVLSDAESV